MNRSKDSLFLRIHSSCIFSEAFHAIDCDCGRQLDAALEHIKLHGGLIIYLYQEGRGLGLAKKIEAISLEKSRNLDTAQAFNELGNEPDPRSYDAAIHVLKELGVTKVILGTDNPQKVEALERGGISVIERVHLEIETNELIDNYRSNKIRALGHHENS
jgi:GTP cyclohydrolase II